MDVVEAIHQLLRVVVLARRQVLVGGVNSK